LLSYQRSLGPWVLSLLANIHGIIVLLQGTSMSLNEVSAAVSVLLGFAPPAALPVLSSSQVIYTSPGTS